MSEAEIRQAILHHIKGGRHLTLFLDFDGTLVPIAPTPAQAIPDQNSVGSADKTLSEALDPHPGVEWATARCLAKSATN